MLLRYAANDENPDVVAWSAGTLLNCAAGRGADFAAELLAISPPPVAALVGCLAPDVTDEKYDDAQVALYELQRANAAGALMNLVAVSDGVTANAGSVALSSSIVDPETKSTSMTSDESKASPSNIVRFCLSTLDSGNLDHTASGNMYSPSASYLERVCSRVAE